MDWIGIGGPPVVSLYLWTSLIHQHSVCNVILLDIEMPGGDGFLVLERLKANKLLSAIPVIIVIARDPKEEESKALQIGAVTSLQKPVNIDNLMVVIEQALNTSHQTGGPRPT